MIFQDPMSSINPLIPVGKQVGEMIREHHKDISKEKIRQEVLELFRKVRIPEPEKRYNCYPHDFPRHAARVMTPWLWQISRSF